MNKSTRILIVDDDERNIRILREILADDFDLYSAFDGESALIEAKKIIPDIILLDIMMPGIDGYEVCKQLKQSNDYRNIKIILVSGKALTEERIKGYEAGADDFVVKPFDMDELHAKVHVFAKLKSLEEINKLKSDFLCLINHETGTPLNHIIGASELLLMNESMDNEIISSVKDINHAAHSLNDKISNILFLSGLKQSTLSDIVEIDIGNIVSEAIGYVDRDSSKVDVQFPTNEIQTVKGNFVQLHKLFLSIFKNAVDVSSSKVVCRICKASNQDGLSGVLIKVEDSAPDITDSQLLNFFDPFYVDDLMLHSEGLNTIMAICSEIITMHHGTVEINRNSTVGTCLSVWLPHTLPE